jgi:hypothetical protein
VAIALHLLQIRIGACCYITPQLPARGAPVARPLPVGRENHLPPVGLRATATNFGRVERACGCVHDRMPRPAMSLERDRAVRRGACSRRSSGGSWTRRRAAVARLAERCWCVVIASRAGCWSGSPRCPILVGMPTNRPNLVIAKRRNETGPSRNPPRMLAAPRPPAHAGLIAEATIIAKPLARACRANVYLIIVRNVDQVAPAYHPRSGRQTAVHSAEHTPNLMQLSRTELAKEFGINPRACRRWPTKTVKSRR